MTELDLGEQRAKELGLFYKSCKQWADISDGRPDQFYYLAHEINRLLGEGHEHFREFQGHWGADKVTATHTGLLIGIRPIVKESEERELLAEMAEYITGRYSRLTSPQDEEYRFSIANRAKKLLEKK